MGLECSAFLSVTWMRALKGHIKSADDTKLRSLEMIYKNAQQLKQWAEIIRMELNSRNMKLYIYIYLSRKS